MPTSRKRSKKSRRVHTSSDERRYIKASRIPRSLASLESMESSYPKVFAEHLGVLMFERRALHRRNLEKLPTVAWDALSIVPMADALLSLAGAGWPEDQMLPRDGKWGTHLRWSLDQYVEVHRLIQSGMIYGALVTGRMFLERWTMNLAGASNLAKLDGEADKDFISRVWSQYSSLTARDAGADWAWLSECIHGRAPFDKVLSPLITGRDRADVALEQVEERLLQTIRAFAIQLLVSIEHEASLQGLEKWIHVVGATPKPLMYPTSQNSLAELELLGNATLPLDPSVTFDGCLDDIIEFGESYEETISRERALTVVSHAVSPYHLVGSVLNRRMRSALLARKNYINELELADSDLGHGSLYARLYRYGAMVEAALLVAGDVEGEEKVALQTAALALHSAWQLWLDDTDITLGCIRGVLEQTARARTHRLKTERAARLELRSAAPSRWIEAAGLGRLNPVGRALGEFSHLTFATRRISARELLIEVQPEGTPYPGNTARLHALDSAAYLLANEVLARLTDKHPALADAFRRDVTLMASDQHMRFQEDLMERSLRKREHPWSGPDFS